MGPRYEPCKSAQCESPEGRQSIAVQNRPLTVVKVSLLSAAALLSQGIVVAVLWSQPLEDANEEDDSISSISTDCDRLRRTYTLPPPALEEEFRHLPSSLVCAAAAAAAASAAGDLSVLRSEPAAVEEEEDEKGDEACSFSIVRDPGKKTRDKNHHHHDRWLQRLSLWR